ncbi:MAG: putative lipid II flippase FtsW, partial [Candidatus Omnitrophica bacterium]|nr:putative lipid II flippase FtsW [Candidatus Omnitrophota bacterium]
MRNVRIHLFLTTFILICIGIVMIYSASSIYALERYKDSLFFLKRHLVFLFLGSAAMFFVMSFDYKKLKAISKPLLFIAIVLLVMVLIPGLGREVSGARRWFRFKIVSFQPSEFANLAIIVYAADFISRKETEIRTSVKALFPIIVVLGMCSMLILMQPDLGTTVAVSFVVFTMLFLSGVRISYFLYMITGVIPLLYLLVFSVPYRRNRIMAFLNPWADPRGTGFQIIQSQVAFGSGGVVGVGLGRSMQKLFYLPAAHTDFIFSIIGEELGFIGTLGVIALFFAFIVLCLKIIKRTSDRFGYLLCLGLTLMISFKAMVNIGVSCGMLPTKGLPLPFISYGGSSLIFDMV